MVTKVGFETHGGIGQWFDNGTPVVTAVAGARFGCSAINGRPKVDNPDLWLADVTTKRCWVYHETLLGKAPTRAAHDVKIEQRHVPGGATLRELDACAPLLLAKLIGDASANELHELSKWRVRPAGTAGECENEARYGGIAVAVKGAQADSACRSIGRAADPQEPMATGNSSTDRR